MINNIPTFLISCDEFPERKKITSQHLKDNGVNFNYWRGLHGKTSGIKTTIIHNYYADGTPYYINPATVSLILNHLFLYQHCLINDYEQIIVLEDDVYLENNWKEKMISMFKQLPEDYDMVYLGWCHEGHERNFKNYKGILYNEVDDCIFGTHALLISKKGLKILIDNNRILEKPLDIQIYLWSIPKMKYFVCYPSLIKQKSQLVEKEKIWHTTLTP